MKLSSLGVVGNTFTREDNFYFAFNEPVELIKFAHPVDSAVPYIDESGNQGWKISFDENYVPNFEVDFNIGMNSEFKS